MSSGRMALPTVIIGGFGMVFMAGATQAESISLPLCLGALAIWGFLAFLWWIHFRNERLQKKALANPLWKPKPRGGFWVGVGIGVLVALGLYLVAFVLTFTQFAPEQLRVWAALYAVSSLGAWGFTVLPLAFGFVLHLVRATRAE